MYAIQGIFSSKLNKVKFNKIKRRYKFYFTNKPEKLNNILLRFVKCKFFQQTFFGW